MSFIDHQRNILDFTLSSFIRRKAKNIALISVYTAVVALLASAVFFTSAVQREAQTLLAEAPEMVVQRMVAGRHDLIPVGYVDEIKKIRGVREVKPRLWGYYYDPAVGANYTLMVPDDFPYPQGSMVIGRGIARARRANTGDVFPLRGYDGMSVNLKVVKVLSPESELVAADLIMLSEKDFKALSGMPEGRYTDITLRVRNPRELVTIAGKITEALPDTRPIIRDEVLRTYDAVFNWRGGMMVVVLAGAVLAFIIFAWDKASGLSAEERREIGILKAIGWETSDVLLMKFWEGTVVSMSAFLMGVLLAYGHVFFFHSALFEPALKGWSVLFPDFHLSPHVDLHQVSTLFFLTVVPYTIATIVPSWRAAIMDPDTVMRES